MFNSRGRRQSFSRQLIEHLEGRALLSSSSVQDLLGPVIPGYSEIVEWYGSPLKVKSGSWLISMDGYVGNQVAEGLALRVAAELGVTAESVRSIARGRWAELTTKGNVTEAAVRAIENRIPGVTAISPNRLYDIERTPNDSGFPAQWWAQNTGQFIGRAGTPGADIHATQAWETTVGSRSVIIGVTDTGLDYNHPDLAANVWTNPGEIPGNGIDDDNNGYTDDVHGWDFGENDNDATNDIVGHGTNVAGCIAALGNNGVGIAGVAWTASLLPLKVADSAGGLSEAGIIAANDYATMMRQRGINIAATNNSYGGIAGTFYDDLPDGRNPEKDSIAAYLASGGTFIAAAGNDSLDNDSTFQAFPASYNLPGVIAVAATNNQDTITGFSNYGLENVDLGAPGEDIYTTFRFGDGQYGYSYTSGTSFSSPITAGAVALLRTINPALTAPQIREILINSADPVPSLQGRTVSGGRLNVDRALKLAFTAGPQIRSVTPGPVTAPNDVNTNLPIQSVTVTLSKPINATVLQNAGLSAASLKRAGADTQLGSGDDITIPISGVTLSPTNAKVVVISLNLSGLPGQRLPFDRYRLTLNDVAFRDLDGNYLNGNTTGGSDATYDFSVIAPGGANETNDALGTATRITFDTSGTATFAGAAVGNGLFGANDVDLYRIDVASGGQITAEVKAKRLSIPSTLDGVLRLFDASGRELARSDQFFGADPYIDYFVAIQGTYYVGVSGFGNLNYNPKIAASGSPQSQGTYDLFLTATLFTSDVVSSGGALPAALPIPPAGTSGTTVTTLFITDNRQILDMNVRLLITHEYRSDLIVSLRSPAGTTVQLINRRGGAGANFGSAANSTTLLLDDEAPNAIADINTQDGSGTYRPDANLSAFDGQAALGLWTLTINDAAAIHAGALVSFGIDFTPSTDVYGPFEINDTRLSAKELFEITAAGGVGAAIRDGFLGDGGFGLFDRDIFFFAAEAGTTLTATSSSFGLLNSALRLFDSAGNQLAVSSPVESLGASIRNYIFNSGGVFYIAVSESTNVDYNIEVVTSGLPASTTGDYRLELLLARGVSDPSTTVKSSTLEVGVSDFGTLLGSSTTPGVQSGQAGIRYNGVEYLFRDTTGTPSQRSYFGASAGGVGFFNRQLQPSSGLGSAFPGVPMTTVDQSDAYNRRLVTRGAMGSLSIERTLSFGLSDNFVAFDVRLTNLGGTALTDVSWAESFNAEMGMNLTPRTPLTRNDVDQTRNMALSSYFNSNHPLGLTIAMSGVPGDGRAQARVISSLKTFRDSAELLSSLAVDPNGTTSDDAIGMVYNLGTLDAAGGSNSSVTLRYFVFVGDGLSAITAQYDKLVNGTGGGHLTADPAAPAAEVLTQPDSSTVSLLQLPYRVYYPEGYADFSTSTFLPITNISESSNRIQIIARYESAGANDLSNRDQVISEFTLPGASRGGITITTPEMYLANTQLVTKDKPYSLEIRSQAPVAATFSHYNQFLLAGGRAAIGESFTTRVSSAWSFANVQRDQNPSPGELPEVADFILFQNTTGDEVKVETTFYPASGAAPVMLAQTLGAYRRGGWNVNDLPQLAPGSYAVTLSAGAPIVAALSHYGRVDGSASGLTGSPSAGSTNGALPAGRLGAGSTKEVISVLNANTASASVTFSFLLSDGSTYRSIVTVPARSQRSLDVSTLVQFPSGQSYSILYSATRPVTVSFAALEDNEGNSLGFGDQGYSLWAFGEGFRPPSGSDGSNLVSETLQLFNPNSTDTLVEITIRFDNNLGQETFRYVVPARRGVDLNVHDFVTGSRRDVLAFYGLTVKSATPIVAAMNHWDRYFPGAFSTLGTPLGLTKPIS